jgi:hypothetical protein
MTKKKLDIRLSSAVFDPLLFLISQSDFFRSQKESFHLDAKFQSVQILNGPILSGRLIKTRRKIHLFSRSLINANALDSPIMVVTITNASPRPTALCTYTRVYIQRPSTPVKYTSTINTGMSIFAALMYICTFVYSTYQANCPYFPLNVA